MKSAQKPQRFTNWLTTNLTVISVLTVVSNARYAGISSLLVKRRIKKIVKREKGKGNNKLKKEKEKEKLKKEKDELK